MLERLSQSTFFKGVNISARDPTLAVLERAFEIQFRLQWNVQLEQTSLERGKLAAMKQKGQRC